MNKISIIAAISSKTRAIGSGGKLLFKISKDLRRFKNLTDGHPVVMGRKTFESIGHTLPNRTNIIISRNPNLKIEKAVVCSSLEKAMGTAKNSLGGQEIFVIGGGEIYKQALPYTDRLYLTVVESDATGDAFFPEYSDFSKIISEENHIEPGTNLHYKSVVLEK